MKRGFLLLLLALCTSPVIAQPVSYFASFPDAKHHEARITYHLPAITQDTVTIWMSRSSPGRYALHEFAKNVYDVVITNAQGDTLDAIRKDPYSWTIPNPGSKLNFNYTLFADHADGTYAGIDETHAHFNMPAGFAWAEGYEDQPIIAKFEVPEGSNWKVATQLKPTDDPYTFTAPDLQYFMDSPTELSDFWMGTWTISDTNGEQTMRMVLHHDGTEKQAREFVDMTKKVVDQLIAVYGEAPQYDYGTYTFLADYLPYVYGDGMEHRNSTILTSTRPLSTGAMRNLGTVAHEFFHCWNIERIRPAGIEPFDFTRVNMTNALWFGEGFTSYYDDLSIRRARLIDDATYARRLAGTLNYVLNYPGSQHFSAAEMSMQAPFVDAARSVDAQNKTNTFISYYSWGSMLGLGLDLTLRAEYDLTLDHLMRAMWKTYGKPEVPYTLDNIRQALAEVTGDADFAQQWFDNYVYGHQMMDYDALLAQAGFVKRPTHPGKAILVSNTRVFSENKDGLYIEGNLLETEPLYQAGLDRRDVLISVEGQPVKTEVELNEILRDKQPGDTVTLTYRSRLQTHKTDIKLATDPTFEIVPIENTDHRLKRKPRKFREAWLGSKVD
jgi:predicted metalloprotease with PDZ domain